MTIRHFKIFIAVCDRMNMTAAAKTLYMSQSAVSQAIAELERYYGIRLFERLSRKLYLTQAGEKLLSYARHMIRMSAEAETEMKTLNEKGSFRIGASVTVGAHVLPKLVSGYRQINKETEIEVVEDNTERIEKLILNDGIDLALVEGETISSDIVKQDFMEDELILICSPAHRLAGVENIEPYELEKEKFIVREKGSGTRKLFEESMAAAGIIWSPAWTCSGADTIKAAVAEGLGISVISRLSVVNEIRSGQLLQATVKGMEFKRKFKVIYHKNKYLTGPMRHFIDICLPTVD
jgi:DNA-binding transcriptional LysR family regulator